MDAFDAVSGGNDAGGATSDESPDDNGDIFVSDAPNLDVSGANAGTCPVNSVASLRFSAREWITWNGAVISEIQCWHSFITIKKTSTGWQRVTSVSWLNEIGEGENTTPFTVSEAQTIGAP